MPSEIEWTNETLNPIRARLRSDPSVIGWHCEHKSRGCEHCYAEKRNLSGRCNLGTKLAFKPGHRKDVEIFLDEKVLAKPLHWRKPRKVFVCSMTDLFADFVPDEMIDRVFAVMALCPQHTFQVLTKRADRMRAYLSNPMTETRVRANRDIRRQSGGQIIELLNPLLPLPNVWLGVSVEDQQRADERRADFETTPGAVKFVSYEPALGPVDWTGWEFVQQIIGGGESGPKARPMHGDWQRATRDFCAARGIAYFFKQWGAWAPCQARDGVWPADGRNHCRIAWDGRHHIDGWPMQRVAKKLAGRLLDGVAHDGMPA